MSGFLDLFRPGVGNIPVVLPDADERVIGYAGQLVAAVLQTAGLFAQSEVLKKFTPILDSIGALIFIWCVIGAIISWALYGRYREALYFLIGPALFWFVLGTTVKASSTAWQHGERNMSASRGNLMQLLNWPQMEAEYAKKDPDVSWFFAFYDNLVSSVVQTLVTFLVDTKNKEDLIIASRERMLTRLYAADGAEQDFIQLIAKGLMGQCGKQVWLNHQISQTDERIDRRKEDYQAELQQLESFKIKLDPTTRAYIGRAFAYHQGSKTLSPEGDDNSFVESAAQRLIRQAKLEKGYVPEDASCGDLWKYTAIASLMIGEQYIKSDYSERNEPGVPWHEVKQQVASALVYDNCLGGLLTPEQRQIRAEQAAAAAPKRAVVEFWMVPATASGPGTFYPPDVTPPANAKKVTRVVDVLQDLGGGKFKVKMVVGGEYVGQFDVQEANYIKPPPVATQQSPKLGDLLDDKVAKKACTAAELERISSRAAEVVAAIVIRNTIGQSVFQNISSTLTDQNGWDPAMYRTVFGNVARAEGEARKSSIIWFAGSIPYLQGVLLFLLSMTFPFFSLFLLMPGKISGFTVWMSAWLWVKSWDVGFAALFFFRDLIWQYMQNDIRVSNNIRVMDWGSPDLIFKVMFQNDPLANMNTYFHIVALFMLSVPLLTAHLALGASDIVEALRDSIDVKATQFGSRKGRATRRMEGSMVNRYISERKVEQEKAFSAAATNDPGKNQLGEHRHVGAKGDMTPARFSATAQRLGGTAYMTNENQLLHRNMLAAVTGRKMSYTAGLAKGVVEAYAALRNEKYQGPNSAQDHPLLPIGWVDNRHFNESMGLTIGVEGAVAVDQFVADVQVRESDGQ